MKCPRCGSTEVRATTFGQRVFAVICAAVVRLVTPPVVESPSPGHKGIFKEIWQYRGYKCSKCSKEFKEQAQG